MKTPNDGMHSNLYWPARVSELEAGLRDCLEHFVECLDSPADVDWTSPIEAACAKSLWERCNASVIRARALLGDKGTRE